MTTDRPATTPSIAALSVDLMDRSKISAAFDDVTLVRRFEALVDAAPEVALVDLARIGEPARLSELSGRVIAFGSHVDEDRLAAAAAAGADALARSVFFRRLADGSLI